MSNPYFKFKQFTVRQDMCAMKVSTDACIQGAWTPIMPCVRRVLDIGAGTGLLSLMLAQRNGSIEIDAVELDTEAAQQAAENIASSPFAGRITIVPGDVITYSPITGFDLIICNPPFFNNSLLGDTAARNVARHTLALTHELLIKTIKRLLNGNGYASVLLPVSEQAGWERLLALHGLYIQRRLFVKPYSHHAANRVITIVGRTLATVVDEELVIYKGQNSYTDDAIQLLGGFYAKDMR